MTQIGSGGVKITLWRKSKRFHRDYDKLTLELRDLVDQKLQELVKVPMPPGLRFEKIKAYTSPDIYTFHVTGNYKVSLEINGGTAFLRRVADHDEIDRTP